MSNPELQTEAYGIADLKKTLKTISELDGVKAIAVPAESLRREGAIVMRITGGLSEEVSIPTEMEVLLAGDERQVTMQLDPWGMGSPSEVPLFIEDEVAVDDGVEFLQQYARDPRKANLYKLVHSKNA